MDHKELAKLAVEAKEFSYSPYSKFRVGAALLTENGNIYKGANIENAAYGATMCAERVAVYSAIMNKENNFTAIAIAGDSSDFVPPCGSCRQVLLELCGPDLDVIFVKEDKEIKSYKLSELIPFSFGDKQLRL